MIKIFNDCSEKNTESKMNVMKRLGEDLRETLLPEEIQLHLKKSKARHLCLELDARLIQIPWELISINNELLCDHFSMGRKIKTNIKTRHSDVVVPENQSLNMWVIANPAGDLEEATREAFCLCDHVNQFKSYNPELVNCSIDSNVSVLDITGNISKYDVLHFAGHADSNLLRPEENGWKLKNGYFTAGDINKLTADMRFPSLIVSNACDSAITDQWEWWRDEKLNNPGTLPAAFILSGVRHFIGTAWKIKDESGILFTRSFYQQLLSGDPIGIALKHARKEMLIKGAPVCRSAYILYGDPDMCYTKDNRPYMYYPEQDGLQENGITLSIRVEKMEIPKQTESLEMSGTKDFPEQKEKNHQPRQRSSFQERIHKIVQHPQWLLSCLIAVIVLLSTTLYMISIEAFKGDIVRQIDQADTSNSHRQTDCWERNIQIENATEDILIKLSKIRSSDNTVNPAPKKNTHTSKPVRLAVALSPYMACSFSDEIEMIAVSIENTIAKKLWFTIVDRMKPENFLQIVRNIYHYYLSSKNSYEVDILSPDLLIRVDLKHFEEGTFVQMSLLEKNGKVKRFQEPYKSGSILSQVHSLCRNIIAYLEKSYPLCAEILRVQKEKVILSIGKEYNLEEGQLFQTLDGSIQMTVYEISAYTSAAKLSDSSHFVKEGMKVIGLFSR
jgi:hypothetical protein